MDLNSHDVKAILQSKRMTHIFHANTVKTSRSLLALRAFASRHMVQESGLAQARQYTDDIDRRYGIWNCTFFDSVDVHERIRNVNQYGPVLFRASLELLDHVPGEIVRVTKSNPNKWDKLPADRRWFGTVEELEREFVVGCFDQIIVVPNSDASIPIGQFTDAVTLDDPERRWGDFNVYDLAERALREALESAALGDMPLRSRICREGCRCRERYARDDALVERYFGSH